MKYFKSVPEITQVAPNFGACMVTDQVAVDEMRIEYMYRDEPMHDSDSGWAFFSGQESQEYVDNPDNTHVFDVNVVANFDATIIPLLSSPAGSAFERAAGEDEWHIAD